MKWKKLLVAVAVLLFQQVTVNAYALSDPSGVKEQALEQWCDALLAEPLPAVSLPMKTLSGRLRTEEDVAESLKGAASDKLRGAVMDKIYALDETGTELTPKNYYISWQDVIVLKEMERKKTIDEQGIPVLTMQFRPLRWEYARFSPFLEPGDLKSGKVRVVIKKGEGDVLFLQAERETFYSGPESIDEKWRIVGRDNREAICQTITDVLHGEGWLTPQGEKEISHNLHRLGGWTGIIGSYGFGVLLQSKGRIVVTKDGQAFWSYEWEKQHGSDCVVW